MELVVGIPTVGRAATLREVLLELGLQSRKADRVIVCGTKPADIEGLDDLAGVELLLASPGLPRQRNVLMDAAGSACVMVFFDDDFLPEPGFLGAVEQHMAAHPETVVATGVVLADGINSAGLTPEEGRALLRQGSAAAVATQPVFSGYGCNMAVRLGPVRTHGLRFDERLPLYGWQEDVDMSRRLAVHGNVVQVGTARGVHLGVKSGRNSGVRLGYSQVANPIYLWRKRAGYPLMRAVLHLSRNIAKNAARAPWPERYIDRRGRLHGNLLALKDLLTGRIMPERIHDL